MPAVLVAGYLLGIPSARNLDFLGNQDFVWGVALMLSGAFIALAVLRHGAARLRTAEMDGAGARWGQVIRYFVPAAAIVLLVWWLSLSATVYAPDDWLNPLHPSSVMTCLVQWALVAAPLLLFNRRLASALVVRPSSQDLHGSTSERDARSS